MARRKQIPSVDETLRLMLERVRSELNVEIRKLRDQVSSVSRKQAGMERRLARLQADLEELPARMDANDPGRTRRRVSPNRAQQAILDQLRAVGGGYVTSKELGAPLGISRATVAARVRELRAAGFNILSSPRKGYTLAAEHEPDQGNR